MAAIGIESRFHCRTYDEHYVINHRRTDEQEEEDDDDDTVYLVAFASLSTNQ